MENLARNDGAHDDVTAAGTGAMGVMVSGQLAVACGLTQRYLARGVAAPCRCLARIKRRYPESIRVTFLPSQFFWSSIFEAHLMRGPTPGVACPHTRVGAPPTALGLASSLQADARCRGRLASGDRRECASEPDDQHLARPAAGQADERWNLGGTYSRSLLDGSKPTVP